ncbi:hypothetical protein AVEN_163431-1 [Araneus ventricosus]|uniref:Uncharacterized protein n=1 Tax=Araneus ventricosus TaxID=182803 RepID=A0A4Y2W0G6_ARAVE|nr:hypothetical protein AVEN_80522-1 [Araneus ventricosus]GBO30879.1 hypothetical protein AVEN_163431-1 [Araneus ventricosus]
MKNREEISVRNRFNTANELPQKVTEMKLQCTIVLYSIKLLPRRGHVMALQCDHPSRGPYIASCEQHSPCPFSPDLTSCDFFLWGCLKSKVYLGGVPTLTTLKDNILRTVLSIPSDTLLSAIENVVYRMQCVVHEEGGHSERGLVLWCIVISSL